MNSTNTDSISNIMSPIRTWLQRRIVRIVLAIVLLLLLLAAAAIGGVSVYFSNAILAVTHYTPHLYPCRDQREYDNCDPSTHR